LSIFCIIFFINLFLEYNHFIKFKKDKIFVTDAQIITIYTKPDHKILKLKTNNFICFTTIDDNININQNEFINIYLLTSNITFYKYLARFYTPSFNINIINTQQTFGDKISNYISKQHQNIYIKELFNALFLAKPLDTNLRQIFANYGVSHLIAISGFHLGILSFIIYWILYLPYKFLQTKYFPYRNRRFDLLILTTIILFGYLILTNIVPSLLRSFVMFVLGIYFLRSHIKIISFQTLLITVLIIISLYPRLIFSLSLWFSVAGVFYIFLLLKYSQNINKIALFFIFNIWIYLALNPISHYFFTTVSFMQLYSPIITLIFILFYPLELFLHIINYGYLFDDYILKYLQYHTTISIYTTPIWFLIYYIVISFLSIFNKKIFLLSNISFIIFNIWLFI
jgi:competence protein ComEC